MLNSFLSSCTLTLLNYGSKSLINKSQILLNKDAGNILHVQLVYNQSGLQDCSIETDQVELSLKDEQNVEPYGCTGCHGNYQYHFLPSI